MREAAKASQYSYTFQYSLNDIGLTPDKLPVTLQKDEAIIAIIATYLSSLEYVVTVENTQITVRWDKTPFTLELNVPVNNKMYELQNVDDNYKEFITRDDILNSKTDITKPDSSTFVENVFSLTDISGLLSSYLTSTEYLYYISGLQSENKTEENLSAILSTDIIPYDYKNIFISGYNNYPMYNYCIEPVTYYYRF